MTFFERIADVIVANKDDILRVWREVVRANPPPTLARIQLSDADLDDHLPQVLDDLARALRGKDTPKVEQDGAEHGHQRRGLGYQVDECLCELHLFRRVLLDHIETRSDVVESASHAQVADVRRTLLDLMDRSMQASVRQYIGEAENERDEAQQRLQELNRVLQQSHDQKDQFLAVLAHELRNPLAPIMTSAAVLKQPEVSLENRRRLCGIIERQTQYQRRLLDDLLDVNRIEHGKIDVRCEVMDLRDAVRHALESCVPGIQAKSQQLRTDIPDEPVQVFADRVRIAQVITNLLGNASKFTAPDGAIAMVLQRDDDHAVLQVRDDGTGIAAGMLPRIFELFAQADSSLERQEHGLGVGLWLAKRLVELHHGTLDAASEGIGRGALFTLRVPLAKAAAATGHSGGA
jgi:signal transduction histidine kinase